MITKSNCYLIYILFICVLSVISCTSDKISKPYLENQKLDSLYRLYKDDIITDIDVLINTFKEMQPEIEDSVNRHKLMQILSELYMKKVILRIHSD